MRVQALFPLYPPLKFDTTFHIDTFKRLVAHFQTPRALHFSEKSLGGHTLVARTRLCTATEKRRYFKNLMFVREEGHL